MTQSTGAAFAIEDIAMLGYGAADYEGSNLGTMLDQAVLTGANYVTLGSTTVVDLATGAVVADPSVTTNFSDMGSAIRQAEARGLNVMIDPQIGDSSGITFSSPGQALSDPAAFFANYKSFILQWAALAQADHVAILSIGSEMLAATGSQYTAYWDGIISAVRGVYGGKLTYFALESEVSQIGFWNKLDYVGVDVFPDLSSAANPTVAQLDAGWSSTVSALTGTVGTLDMPVLFTAAGVASISGAAAGTSTDGEIGQAGTVTNTQLQADWWQSFFETWGADPPSWLAGISVWNNDPNAANLYAYYQQDYSIYDKPATALIASWFGAGDYLQPLQSAFTGTQANDRIKLYGSAATGTPANQDATFQTVIAIKAHGQVVDGVAPTIDIQVNGIDMGIQTFSTTQTGVYEGLTYTGDQTFHVTLNGLQKISDLRVVLETADSQNYISSVTVGTTSLISATYYPAGGGSQAQTIGTSANQWDLGYTEIGASAWNNGLSTGHPGTATLPIEIQGGGGSDIVDVLGLPTQYRVSGIGTAVVTISESSGLDQNAILDNISYLQFADGAVLDLSSGVWSVDASVATVAAHGGDYAGLISAGLISSVIVTDSAADVLAGLPTLESWASARELGSIVLTDATNLDVSPARVIAFAAALAKLSGAYTLTISTGPANLSFAGIAGHGTIVVFSGDASEYGVTGGGDGTSFTITDGTYTDHLSSVTALQFADHTELVASQIPAVDGGVSSAQVADLYAAVLARIPDVPGLAFYQAYAAANPATPIATFSQWFLSAPEYTASHSYAQSAAGDAQFIADTYENLLHRAPESGAVDFYQGKVIDPILAGAPPGTAAVTQAELRAHAQMLTYFSVSAEFLADVQVTAAHPADAQHWLVLI